jgi:uncharacterized OsmC-like protein
VSSERIKTAFMRNAAAVEKRPSLGQGTAVTKVRRVDGLHCEIEDGQWKLTADLAPKSGGTDAGPNPGVLGRSALGSCLLQAYSLWAARLDIPISSLSVEVHADYDVRGMHGADDVFPGYSEIRLIVELESSAPEAEVLQLLDKAERHCPYFQIFEKPIKLERQARITHPKG